MTLVNRLAAEFIGTFWLVFAGCGSALFAAGVKDVGIGYLGVALAFGLTVLTMAYTFGHISGGHFNPAVSVGLYLAKRFDVKDLLPYILTQVVAGIAAGGLLYAISSGQQGFKAPTTDVNDPATAGAFATNGYGNLSPQHYSLAACLIAEIVLTAVFLLIILGSTDRRAPKGFAPIAIGLGLTLIHLVGIPITNLSVNPARSSGVALFAGGGAVTQLWLFWVAPLIGGAIAGVAYRFITGDTGTERVREEAQPVKSGPTRPTRPVRPGPSRRR